MTIMDIKTSKTAISQPPPSTVVEDEQALSTSTSTPAKIANIILRGDSRVGKSQLWTRCNEGKYSDLYKATIGMDFTTKVLKMVDGNDVKFQLWDTSGQERFRDITSVFYKNAGAVILMYDITNKETFDHLPHFIREIDNLTECIKFIVGNKIDKEAMRKVTFEEGQDYAKGTGCHFMEISVAENINVDNLFTLIAKELYKEWNPSSVKWWGVKGGVFAKT